MDSHFEYDGSVSKIKKVVFGIMSPEMIRRQSVVEVVHHDTFCGSDPVSGGLFDPRMGILEYGNTCTTDQQTNKETPGYFGHIELANPVFHVQFFPVVQKIVRCVCYRCGEPLFTGNNATIPIRSRLNCSVEQSKKVKNCPSCNAVQPDKYVKTDLCKMHACWLATKINDIETEESTFDMTSKYVLNLFKKLSDDTCYSIGINPKLSHPSWMIMEVFPVSPPSCRPSVHQDNGQRMEDDITIKYCDIIKYNKFITQKLISDPNAKIIDDWINILQYHTATLIDNEIAGVLPAAQRSGRPLKGLRQRLKGKEGRIRGNLMGKRVNFSSRTVITPDPIIDLDELGVPKRIAIMLTYPEKVTKKNIRKLKQCVINGCTKYPGARAVYKYKNKKTISLNHIDKYQFSQMLEIGDVVIRHIANNDWVIFNRQPSLHKMSMMAHKIRILEGLTFRLNISATTPYNADFDGDEMNMHVPQSIIASNEIKCLACVNNQIVSPALNMPIITFVQDAVLGGHLMTMKNSTKFSHREMMNVLSWTNTIGNNLSKEMYDGINCLSFCIPKMNLKIKNRRGELITISDGNFDSNSGSFDKKVFTSLIHSIFRDKGPNECAAFFNNCQHVIRAYLIKNSFSVGIRDLVLETKLSDEINLKIDQQKLEVNKTIQTLHLNMFENMTSNSKKNAFEDKVTRQLTAARSSAENLLKKTHDSIYDNRFMNMVNGGSKGKLINLAQMTACLGQQIIEGRRVPYGFLGRTLPHFTKYDDTSEARGFVHNSFQKGMNPLEFFFHAMAGREGIIDTAVKSVTYDTKIIIVENKEVIYTEIGKWIDNHLENNKSLVNNYKERNLELLKTDNILIPTTDYNGNISWGNVTAITRHDPGEKLYKITTLSGRTVTVTENKSLLIWNNKTGEFKEKLSDQIIIGDFVPVTAHLKPPPNSILKTNVELQNYLPNTKYLYGTEFNKAIKLKNEATLIRKNLPKGWWETKMKNKEFTLPFPLQLIHQKCIRRLHNTNIDDNYVYPKIARKHDIGFPANFELNKENGIFIGLYLADGNSRQGFVTITNNEKQIINFVKNWFNKFNIPIVEKSKIIKNSGKEQFITSGTCSVLCNFINKFLGKKSENKFVPNEAFIASDDFVKGILSGYFSGDGHFGNDGITISSSSYRLMEGIAMLCTRIGVFAKISKTNMKSKKNNVEVIPNYRLSIRSNWAAIFKKEIDIISDIQSNLMNKSNYTKIHRHYKNNNDVVLDKIIQIEIIGVEKNPKMYDLTIPSTLNFGLANGLQVRDTSSTGYIQRKLMKALEDYKISWCKCVKDAQNNVIQFLYGDDNVDGTSLEYQNVPILRCTDFYQEYINIPNLHIKTKKRLENMTNQLQEMYKWYSHNICYDSPEASIKFPINFDRTLINSINKNSNENETTITPDFILDEYESLLERIKLHKYNDGLWMFKFMLYQHCHPKKLICDRNINTYDFKQFVQSIEHLFIKSHIEPGDAVGPVAAQSIGEPCTQLTLNTFHLSGVGGKSTVTRGVPRLQELFHLSKNPKNTSLTIILNSSINTNKLLVEKVSSEIGLIRFNDLVKRSEIRYENKINEYSEFERFNDLFEKIDLNKINSKWVLTILFDAKNMFEKRIEMEEIYSSIFKLFDSEGIYCTFSDDNSENIFIRIKINPNVQQFKKNIIQDEIPEITILTLIETKLMNNLVIRGVDKIESVTLRQDIRSASKKEWMIDTIGTNILDVILHPQIDKYKTTSNDIHETYSVFGIEASRNILITEIREVMDEASDIDARHVHLLVDMMTSKGKLIPIDRNGMKYSTNGPFAKCSFEEADTQLYKAAIFGETDHITGVSSNIILGQCPPCGTGIVDVSLDEHKFAQFTNESIKSQKYNDSIYFDVDD